MALTEELKQTSDAIISLHRELFGESPSPMKLQKLCYYAQAFHMAQLNAELFPEDFQAWQHGPVIPELYQRYRDFSWHPISTEVEHADDLPHGEFLREVVMSYGRFDGAALSTMTHRESPWIDARDGLEEMAGSTSIIPKSAIKEYFCRKLRMNG